MKLFRFVLRYSRTSLFGAIFTGIVSGVCTTALLAIINSALHKSSSPVTRVVYMFVALALAAPIARALSEIFLLYLAQDTLYQLRIELSRKVLRLPLRRLEEIGANKVLGVLTEDLTSITNLISLIPVLAINASIVLGCLLYMGLLSPRLLLIVVAFITIGALSYQISIIKAVSRFRAAREEQNNLMGHFQSLFLGIKELKLHDERRSAFMDDVLKKTATTLRKQTISGYTIYTIASIWGQFLVFIVVGLLALFISNVIYVDDQTLTGFVLVLFYLIGPLQMMMNVMPQVGRANVAVAHVDQLGLALDNSEVESETSTAKGLVDSWELLELTAVTYVYRNENEEQFALGPIDMRIRAGETVFVAGGNGSGKTTLAKVLVGLYRPDTGEILFDGEKLTNKNLDAYRQNFSAVFFDFHLFEELIGIKGEELDARARGYLEQLHLGTKVSIERGRLSTTELSQGQRKRLALLTAYLEDRPVYLFDEWAADQDPVFKNVFYFEILADLKARGKTVIVISHDDRYYAVGDRIIKLDGGYIVSDNLVASDLGTPVY